MGINDGAHGEYVFELGKIAVDGQRMDANDIIRGDGLNLDFAADKVEAIEVAEVANKEHMEVDVDLDTDDFTTCAAVEGVWFSDTTEVAVTVGATDYDWGTSIASVTAWVNGVPYEQDMNMISSAYMPPMYYYDAYYEFNGLFTEDGTYEIQGSATNDASDPVTKIADEMYTVVIDTTDPEVGITSPTSGEAIELNVGDMLEAEGTVNDENLAMVETALHLSADGVTYSPYNGWFEADVSGSDWMSDIDLSDVDFQEQDTLYARLFVKATDCAGNWKQTSVNFMLKDTTPPKWDEIVEIGENWVTVSIDENFKLSDQIAEEAFAVTVNQKDYEVVIAELDAEAKEVKLVIIGTFIEDGDKVSASYNSSLVAQADRLMDSAGNYAVSDVTPIYTATDIQPAVEETDPQVFTMTVQPANMVTGFQNATYTATELNMVTGLDFHLTETADEATVVVTQGTTDIEVANVTNAQYFTADFTSLPAFTTGTYTLTVSLTTNLETVNDYSIEITAN